jgi:hypothetical protein
MRPHWIALLLALRVCAQDPSAPPAPEEQSRVIESARDSALDYTATLPNFICTETMRRYKSDKRTEPQRLRDTLVLDLAFSGKGERYKLLTIDGKPTAKPLEKAGGIKSRGEFGSMLEHIFDARSSGQFLWERWDDLRGRRVHVLFYRIDQAHSKFGMHLNGFLKDYRMTAAFHGWIFVEPETHRILRLTYEAEDIPAKWPIVHNRGTLDYGEFEINGKKHLLPQRVETRLDQRGGGQLRNEIEFSNYRKFSAEATMTFEKQ